MTTYADPTRCPDCRAMLPHDPQACRVCALPLTGETAISLFAAFQEADRLLGLLRAQKRPQPAAVGAQAPTGSMLDGVAPFPAAAPPRPGGHPGPRVRGASVPKILLSLGALCLLVAGVIFLAVAWRWLGVGGRTVVLVGLTGTALGLAVAMHRRRLRMAAEALSVVGLGLLALDVVGVRHAGWLGEVTDARLVLLSGCVVATGAMLMLLATSARPLVAPALIAPLAVLTAWAGAQVDARTAVPAVATVLVLLALGRIGTVLPSRWLRTASIASAALGWLYLVPEGLDHAGTPVTVAHYVGHLAAWPLLSATVLAGSVGPITGAGRRVTLGGYAVAGLLGSYTVLLPALDNAETAMALAVLAVSAAWVAAVAAGPRRLRPAALLPLGGTLVVPTVVAAQLAAEAAHAAASVGSPFSRSFAVHVMAATTSASPLLLLPVCLVLAAAGCSTLALVEPVRRPSWVLAAGGAAALGGFATLPLYDVPLALVVGTVVVAAVAGLVVADRISPSAAGLTRLVALAVGTAAVLLALPSDQLTTAVLAVACAAAGYLMMRTDSTGGDASVCFPIAFSGLVWAAGNVIGIDEQLRAIPVLVVLGGLAIWRPHPELEASSAIAGAAVSAAAITLAPDLELSLAVHLTVAGALVTASSILHPSRRLLAWPGGLLLAAATWVRLLDLGVHVPEAYTLPSAVALVVVGVWQLRRDPRSATLTLLAPGLALATVPSLVATLDDPYSLRALLLGLACLGLVVGGAALRWSAPLAVGAVVGTLLVLRELAPYAAQVPTWLTVGLSGTVLLVMGITWESRMHDVRRATRYVDALR
jgi:hypothetical protein